jgi:predicted dehydrogenase
VKKLNVGLIGAGFMGKAHSLAYVAMPMFFWPASAIPHRAMIAASTDESAREAASRFGFESSTGHWEKVVESPSIDIVDIATPNDLHCAIAIAAARAGKHVICEKPLARTVEEARLMYEAVKKAGVTHMVAFNYRRTPAVMLARKFIDEGAIGNLLSFRGVYLQDWSADPGCPYSWRFQKATAGSGALGDIATHVLDMARYLAGEISAVQATLKTIVGERRASGAGTVRPATVDVDDEVTTFLRFANGATGSLEASRNAYGRNNFLAFEVHGTRGSLLFNYERRDELQAFFADDPPDRRGFRTIYTGPAHPYGQNLWPIAGIGIGYEETVIIQCHDFVKAVVERTQPSPNFRDGYQITRIADAIVRSSETQSWIGIEPPPA